MTLIPPKGATERQRDFVINEHDRRLATLETGGSSLLVANNLSDVANASTARLNLGVSPQAPQGRLTLTTGTPVTTSDVSAAATIYYTPYDGRHTPLYDGTRIKMHDFGAELSQALTDATKSPAAAVAHAAYDYFVWLDGSTYRCTRGPNWTTAATVTMTIATPCVVTWTAHGLREGAPVIFTTTGALPTGITAGTIYFVGKSSTANTFNICTTEANVVAGTNIATSGTQSGVHAGTNRDTLRGTGAGTTELEMVQGIYVNKNAITNGPAAQRGAYVGTIKTNASSTVDDKATVRHVSNAYNQVARPFLNLITTNTWTYSTAAWRVAEGVFANACTFVSCLPGGSIFATYGNAFVNSTATFRVCRVGVGYNKTTAFSGIPGLAITGVTFIAIPSANFIASPDIGGGYVAPIEYGGATDTQTWLGDNGQPDIIQYGLTGFIMG